MYEDRKTQIKKQVEMVAGLLEFYQSKVRSEELLLTDAQQTFYKTLQEMQYSGNGYFFAFTTDMVLQAVSGLLTDVQNGMSPLPVFPQNL